MKVLNAALLSLAFPLVAQAGNLIYPEATISLQSKSGNSLQVVSEQLGLGLNAANFKLVETKESLLGKHFYYQQVVNGVEVDGSQVVISANENGEVMKVYNSSVNDSINNKMPSVPFISETMALEAAWSNLQVNGALISAPTAKLVYDQNMNLVYKVSLSTSSPLGHFNVTVDAQSGKVLETSDAALPRMKRAEAPIRNKGKAQFGSFSSALKSFEFKNISKSLSLESVNVVNGTASVFNPNPVVTLHRTDLTDESPASEFTAAYKNEDLKEITFSGGVYSLKGPKVTLIDFEGPSTAPTTTTDGHWQFERGNNGFTDAMTYSHIDRSIRYIESLGFTGSKAVFKKSIEVDSDGLGGADNSHFIPSSNRLAFGHGCVDDNEDSDVVLHELGHAIQFNINNSWMGGDTGAMGEGFGDYWAASYSVTTEGGMDANVNWVFKWDGHNDCWPGRQLNSFSPTYDSARTYSAHSQVNGGVSDELWSTPVFQAFLELYKAGTPKSDIDKVILEAHFGLGSGVKMPTMAQAIVKTAKALFPSKGYDQVFLKHFKKQKML